MATIQVAASVIVAAVCTPMLTEWVCKRAEALGRRAETTQVNEESHVEFDKSQSVVNQV